MTENRKTAYVLDLDAARSWIFCMHSDLWERVDSRRRATVAAVGLSSLVNWRESLFPPLCHGHDVVVSEDSEF